jgi:GLPGLI family protein
MKKLSLFLVVCFLFVSEISDAQVVLQGKIEYTRKMNVHRQFDEWMEEGDNNEYMTAWLAKLPKFDTRNFTYFFTTKQSKYTPVKKEEDPALASMGGLPGTQTIVYSDFDKQKNVAYKKVFEENFLLDDSMKKCTWKILDEVRTIAGFSCRKAVTKINDSVVVVAFYTDKIPVSGGPEMFSGLPGMIMEIAVPRLYTTWIAQNVVIQAPTAAELAAPDKGKKTNLADMKKAIKSGTKDWGKFADKSVWWSTL